MRILILEHERICPYDLPSKVEDSYVFSHTLLMGKECVFTFEAVDEKWIIKSNGSVHIVKSSMIVDDLELTEYHSCNIKVLGVDEVLTLYAMPSIEKETYKLDFTGLQQITIGNQANCNICYRGASTRDLEATIVNNNGSFQITGNPYVFVNNKLVNTCPLNVGDNIFVDGLRVTWMKNFIVINNPENLVTVGGLKAYDYMPPNPNTDFQPATDEEQSVNLYNDDDYFFHVPRFQENVAEEKITIDQPPASEIKEELPFILTIGSTITMVSSTIMMSYNVGYGLVTGTKDIVSTWPQIMMCVAMVIASLILPKVTASYQKKKAKEREEYRVSKYTQYLDSKEKEIELILKKQAQILKDNSLSTSECLNIVNSKNARYFWNRNIPNDDFLSIELGIGSIDAPIEIEAPKERFSLDEDDLLQRSIGIVDKYKKLNDVPVSVSLVDKKITAFICSGSNKYEIYSSIMMQLVALHSAADLKIVIFTDDNNKVYWEYAKFLPHCFSEDKSVRFFATNTEEMKEVSNFLEEEFKRRKNVLDSNKSDDAEESDTLVKNDEYKNFDTYYLIICDNYKNNLEVPIFSNIFKYNTVNYGFSIALFTDSMKKIPAKCETFVEIGDKEGCVLGSDISLSKQQMFTVEQRPTLDMLRIAQMLSNIPIMTKEGQSVLPTSLSFLEMYNVSKIEHLNILNRWQTNNPVVSLTTPIGVQANGSQFKLNLHEKFHGPHGLIAGSTGSGKSEFIITYILSMCVNYHPYEVQFVLIDYKGGGLAGAFENKESGVRIPHLAGTITNLDTSSMNRTLVSIESELKRRQKVFNETRDSLGESTIDIYKYQRLYREGMVKEPMSHLFIISDEFAELKAQQPEFMNQLISTARIGRSLGVHLILATQKPSGVVNDQIWSNTKFRVCLKVADRSDSMEMLKRPEAASIKETGRFYLQVGYDELFDKGQSGWAGAKYTPSDRVIKKVDDSIDFVNNVGFVTKSVKDLVKVDTNDYGDQLTNIVKHIYNIGIKEGIVSSKLWLDPIPENVYVANLKQKYNYKATPYLIDPVIGEYDSPATQQQGLLKLDMSSTNTAIWGQAGAGKENLISTILWSSIIEHTPNEVNFYIIDCGSESLKMFQNFPHVGGVCTAEEEDKIVSTFELIEDEIENRKELMADYGGSYKEYIENSGNKIPLIVCIINNYEVFQETYQRISEATQSLYRDGSKYGVVFIVTAVAPNGIRNRMLQNFSNKLCLQIQSEQEYHTLVNAKKNQIPAKYFGRGLVQIEKECYEFQTAFITERKEINNVIREASKQLENAYPMRAKRVASVPEIVKYSDIIGNMHGLANVPIGFDINTKEPCLYNFQAKKIMPILFQNFDPMKFSFVKSVIKAISSLNDVKVNVIDLAGVIEEQSENVNYIVDNFDANLMAFNNEIMKNKDSSELTVTFIIGVGEMKECLSANGRAVINNLLMNVTQLNNSFYILVDGYSNYKLLQVETWYQSNVDNTYGIWLGDKVDSQMSINIINLSMEDKQRNFPYMGYAVTHGKHATVKYMVEDGDGN